jgi:hypothetical protein
MKLALTLAIALLGFLPAAWMLFDASRRLLAGDYVRINGQLGPWTHAISAIGLDPMSRAVAAFFLACGLARLIATIAYLARASWGWHALLATSIAILWYLPIGTATAVLTIILLFIPAPA